LQRSQAPEFYPSTVSSVAVSVIFGVVEVLVLLALLRWVVLGGMPSGLRRLRDRQMDLEGRVTALEIQTHAQTHAHSPTERPASDSRP
jgi:hypothetical protein